MANAQIIHGESVWQEIARLRESDLECLAPLFRQAITDGLARANARGFLARVEETCRSQQLQTIYYQQGATRALSVLRAWHVYGLAVDLVHPTAGWDWYPGGAAPKPEWFLGLKQAMLEGGLLSAGSDWVHFKDWPHYQWHACKPTPSDLAMQLYTQGGKTVVWRAVGATTLTQEAA